MLDWILSQNWKNTLPLHALDQIEVVQKLGSCWARRDGMYENSNSLQDLTFDCTI